MITKKAYLFCLILQSQCTQNCDSLQEYNFTVKYVDFVTFLLTVIPFCSLERPVLSVDKCLTWNYEVCRDRGHKRGS